MFLHRTVNLSVAAQDALLADADPDASMETELSEESGVSLYGADDTHRTPDLTVFAHKRNAERKKYSYPPLNIELKFPTEPDDVAIVSADDSARAKVIATQTMDLAAAQVDAQAEHIFAEYTLQYYPEFTKLRIWVVVGTFFQVYKYTRGQASPTVGEVHNLFNDGRKNFSRAFNTNWGQIVTECSVSYFVCLQSALCS